jgi:hypothetical protein
MLARVTQRHRDHGVESGSWRRIVFASGLPHVSFWNIHTPVFSRGTGGPPVQRLFQPLWNKFQSTSPLGGESVWPQVGSGA